MRRVLVAAAAVALAVGLSSSAALAAPPRQPAKLPHPAQPVRPADLPDRYAEQQLAWQPCVPDQPELRIECAIMIAPQDWHRPRGGELVEIAVSRLPATAEENRHGVMLLNPGGPGGSGLGMPLAFTEQPIAATYDLIGFDPRGVGSSTRIQCQTAEEYSAFLDIDMRDRSAANIRHVLEASEEIAENCRRRTGELLRYINTDQTVHDMNLIRFLLGERQISYLGFSAGTWLGTHYATKYPHRVDRFVLDSNVQFTTSWQKSFSWQPLGFERRFNEDFLAWMAKYDEVFGYGETAQEARATWEARRASLAKDPLEVSADFTLTAGKFDSGTVGAMYAASLFPGLGQALATLEHFDTATPEEKQNVEAVFGSFFNASLYAVFYAVTCNDTAWKENPQFYVHQSERLGRRYPLIGYSWLGQPCASWPYEQPKPEKITGKGLPPIVMINSVHDPATPIEGALRAHRNFKNSRFVTVVDEGDHGIYGGGNACVDGIVNRYFMTGQAPADGTVCQGLPLPEPETVQALQTPGSDERPENILERIKDFNRRLHDST